ncbi:MAG: hypothetical protein PHH26_05825 [Candidatus Thermoplasmatota archaeon]|nr:hypothetical protein [Candidatus Thermoplasmatota archaeon]
MVNLQKKMDEGAEWATDELNEPHFWLILLIIAMLIIAVVLFALGM